MAKNTETTKNSTRDELVSALEALKQKRDTLTASFKKDIDARYAEHRKQVKALRAERDAIWKKYGETVKVEKANRKAERAKKVETVKAEKKSAKAAKVETVKA